MQTDSLNFTGVRMRSSTAIKEEAAKLQQSSQMAILFGDNCKRSGNEKAETASGLPYKEKINEIKCSCDSTMTSTTICKTV
jgi:hypothetical protein